MTVLKLWIPADTKKTMVHCRWLDENKKEQAGSFALEMLQKALIPADTIASLIVSEQANDSCGHLPRL